MKLSLKSRVYDLLDVTSEEPASRFCSAVIMGLICLNVIAVMLETVDSVEMAYRGFFNVFEIFSVLVFTVEYLLRLWTCTSNVRFGGRVKERVKFALTFFAAIDLLAIVLFYLAEIFVADFRFLRALRLLRLLKLGNIPSRYKRLHAYPKRRNMNSTLLFLWPLFCWLLRRVPCPLSRIPHSPKCFQASRRRCGGPW